MRYLLDTNVLSETMRVKPAPQVLAWLESHPQGSCYVSVLTLGEIRNGAASYPDAKRRAKLSAWLEQTLIPWFDQRTIAIDTEIADRWGRLCAGTSRPLPAVDSLLAATALAHGLTLVTRDAGFSDLPGLHVVNPWKMS